MKTSAVPKIITKGICNFCKGEFDKPKMSQHLRNCKERKAILAGLSTDETKQKTRLFHIQVEGRYAPQYWMHLEIPARASLDDLDDFLRTVWFEHFEHLSGFRIDDTSYSAEDGEDFFFLDRPYEGSEEMEEGKEGKEEEEEEEGEIVENFVDGEKLVAALPDVYLEVLSPDVIATLKQEWFLYDLLPFLKEKQKSAYHQVNKLFNENKHDEARQVYRQQDAYKLMIALVEDRTTDVQLQYVLKVEKKFFYTYDYGESTYVTLRVVSEREGVVRDEEDQVELLALNVPPDIPCVVCGKPATQIVAGYYDVMEHTYCDDCAKKLDEEDEEENEEDEEDEKEEGEVYWIGGEETQTIEIVNSPRVGVVG